MSAKSKAGKAQWRERQSSYADELTDQITKGASTRMDTWTAQGHIPRFIRAKAFARGRAIVLPAKEGQE
jgi:hypothetical protein